MIIIAYQLIGQTDLLSVTESLQDSSALIASTRLIDVEPGYY